MERIDEGTEVHEFAATDSKGRTIGARIQFATEVRPDDSTDKAWSCANGRRGEYVSVAGTFYTFRPQALRNGEVFGAMQDSRYFASETERATAVEQYLAGARKRAGGAQ